MLFPSTLLTENLIISKEHYHFTKFLHKIKNINKKRDKKRINYPINEENMKNELIV